MYLNALEFLEEEREAWRPFEALDTLTDDQLDQEIEGAHGWTARDLLSHLVLRGFEVVEKRPNGISSRRTEQGWSGADL